MKFKGHMHAKKEENLLQNPPKHFLKVKRVSSRPFNINQLGMNRGKTESRWTTFKNILKYASN
jgi:hypothetical protein